MKKKRVIILIGPPGVGKGSQAIKLCKKFNLPHISTGDILRNNIKNKTDLGKKAKDIIEKGELVPDKLINTMLFERIEKTDCAQGYLLDGYPRTLQQAEAFEDRTHDLIELKVINFIASDETVIKRISGRLCCRGCPATYHTIFNPPQKHNRCDVCGSELFQRDDDKENVVRDRLKVYKTQTQPLIHFYEEKKILHSVSCEKSIEEIFTQTCQIILKDK